jgi:tRNA U34 2-thiouridine synthase MnmA/TrmU
MKYKNPSLVTSPKDAISNLRVLYDGGDSSVSIAKMKWKGQEVVGMRWNVGMREWNDQQKKNGKECLGVPTSNGRSIWFIVPDELLNRDSELWNEIDSALKNE